MSVKTGVNFHFFVFLLPLLPSLSLYLLYMSLNRNCNCIEVLPDFAEVDKPIKMEILKNAKQYIASLTSETESLEKELRFLLDQAEDLGLDPEEILESIEASERASAAATAETTGAHFKDGGNVKASSSSHSNGAASSASDSSRERGSYSSSGSSLSPVRKMSSPTKQMNATSPLSNSHSSGRKRFRDDEELLPVGGAAAALQKFSEASKRRASADVGIRGTGDDEDDDDDDDDDN